MIDYSIIVIAKGNHQYLQRILFGHLLISKGSVTLFYTTTKGELNEDILEYCVQNEIKINTIITIVVFLGGIWPYQYLILDMFI